MKIARLLVTTVLFGTSLLSGVFANSDDKVFTEKTCAAPSMNNVILGGALMEKADEKCGKHFSEARAQSEIFVTGSKTRTVWTPAGPMLAGQVCGQATFSCHSERH